MTNFERIYEDYFFPSITDDLYVTLTKEETKEDCLGLLRKAVLSFRYPLKKLTYDINKKSFKEDLDEEECYILALYMILEWIDRQIASVHITEPHYTGADLKAINTDRQLRVLRNAHKHFSDKVREQSEYYQNHNSDTFSLSGKKGAISK